MRAGEEVHDVVTVGPGSDGTTKFAQVESFPAPAERQRLGLEEDMP